MPKSPTLSQAVRGRSMVTRDYTTGVSFKAQERKAEEAVTTAGLGIVQGVAGGVSQLTGAIESNIKSHELAAEGAMSIFESSPEAQAGMTFEESGFQQAEGWRDRWFKSAAEVSETATIGGGTFDTAKLVELGRLSPVSRSKAAGRSLDKHGQPTGEYKSLYEEFRMQEPLDRNITPAPSDDLSQYGVGQMKEAAKKQPEKLSDPIEEKETLPRQKEVVVEGDAPDPEDLAAEAYMKFLKEEGGSSLQLGKRRSTFEEKYPQFKK